MLQDWEAGLVGNNPGIVARMPRRPFAGKIVINLLRGRRVRSGEREAFPSAA